MCTAFYMFRAVSMTFYGELGARSHEIPKPAHGHHDAHSAHDDAQHDPHGHAAHHKPHESPKSMLFALVVLAILSIGGGLVGIPYALGHFFHIPNFFEAWLEPVFSAGREMAAHAEPAEVHPIEYFLMALSVSVAALSIFIGVLLYTKRQEIPKRFVERFPRLYRLVLNKYYVDEIYQALVVNNLLRLNEFLSAFDSIVIDGFVNFTSVAVRQFSKVMGFMDSTFVDGLVNLTANTVLFTGSQVRRLQTGRIQNYLYGAMAGVVLLMIWKMV